MVQSDNATEPYERRRGRGVGRRERGATEGVGRGDGAALLGEARARRGLAEDDTVIWTENDSNDSKIIVQIPKQ